jgi:hypothetical protein
MPLASLVEARVPILLDPLKHHILRIIRIEKVGKCMYKDMS